MSHVRGALHDTMVGTDDAMRRKYAQQIGHLTTERDEALDKV